MTDHAARPLAAPAARPALRPVTRAFIGGGVVGLVIGVALGLLVGAGLKAQPAAWTDASASWIRLPEQTVLGAPPQTFSIPASSYDFGGVAQPLSPAVLGAAGVVRVDLSVQTARVGVSLARPDGGELVSREAVVTPQQGKTTVYLQTMPGAGPVVLLLRAADNSASGASATVTKVQAAPDASLSADQMNRIRTAGLY